MTNEIIKNDTVRLTVEKAKEHAKKIESIIIVTDEDFKIAKKEKATAKKLVDAIGSEITKNRQKALELVEEENNEYKKIKDEIELRKRGEGEGTRTQSLYMSIVLQVNESLAYNEC